MGLGAIVQAQTEGKPDKKSVACLNCHTKTLPDEKTQVFFPMN